MSNLQWGYAANGDARIFDLDDGEKLPKGWAYTPAAYDKAEDTAPADKAFENGARAAREGKEHSIPPAYRGKPEADRWSAGYESERG